MAGASPRARARDPGHAIVVTGVGLCTGLGFGRAVNWRRLLAGESAVRELPPEAFETPLALPVRLGAPVDHAALAARIQRAVPRAAWNTSAEFCHLWLLAALEAMAQAGIGALAADGEGVRIPRREPPDSRREQTEQRREPEGGAAPEAVAAAVPGVADPERVGVYVGSGLGAARLTEREFANVYTAPRPAQRDVSRMVVPKYMLSSPAGQLAILMGFRGPSMALSSACSSGALALQLALDALRLGRIDQAVCGGVDMAVAATVLKGFHNLGALTARADLGPQACRPFDRGRDGIVLGDGAACLVLERREGAEARGAAPLAHLRGGASQSEAHHLLAPRPAGVGMAACMRLALADAQLPPERIAHVYAHGTGTLYNDRCEALALAAVLPHAPTVSATKAQLGHTLGAAGAIDAVVAVLSLGAGRPVPLRREQPDPECAIVAAVPGDPSALRGPGGGSILVNAFAFGGHNTCLVLSPPS